MARTGTSAQSCPGDVLSAELCRSIVLLYWVPGGSVCELHCDPATTFTLSGSLQAIDPLLER